MAGVHQATDTQRQDVVVVVSDRTAAVHRLHPVQSPSCAIEIQGRLKLPGGAHSYRSRPASYSGLDGLDDGARIGVIPPHRKVAGVELYRKLNDEYNQHDVE